MSQKLALLAALVLVGLAFGPGAQPVVTARTAALVRPATATALPTPSPSLSTPSPAASSSVVPSAPSRTAAPKGTSLAQAPAPAVQPRSAVTGNGSWTTYHRDDGHTGYDPSLNLLKSFHNVATGWTTGALDGQVYAEPLVWGGLVFAVTLNNTVYAFNQIDGAVIWQRNLGAPTTSGWTCGNVSPQGILGTPVIDPVAQVIYVAAFFSDNSYHVMGLNANDGNATLVLNTTLVMPASFNWMIQQERGALALSPDRKTIYVPFGGRAGDCGTYHGYVVGVPANGLGTPSVYTVSDTGSGIWSAGGPVVDDATGNVFAATGNGSAGGCNQVGQNDAVVRLAPVTLALQDWFMPKDWLASWCQNDEDLGSAGPLLISPNLLFQSGKRGGGFLLDPNNLGHVDGQLYPPGGAGYTQAEVCFGNQSDATFGSFAYAAPFVYLECDGRGVVAINTNTSAPSFSACDPACAAPNWHNGGTHTFGPPIVAGGAVWEIGTDGSGLWAFDQATGAQLFHSAGFTAHRFVTPSEAGGHVYVPSGNVIRSFNIQFGVLPSSPEPQPSRSPILPATPTPAPGRSPVDPASPPPPPTDR